MTEWARRRCQTQAQTLEMAEGQIYSPPICTDLGLCLTSTYMCPTDPRTCAPGAVGVIRVHWCKAMATPVIPPCCIQDVPLV